MSLKDQISQFCKTIFYFETNVAPLKEQLFNISTVTSQLLWNHMIGQNSKKANSHQIIAFFKKHGFKISNFDASLLFWHYSTYKDNSLNLSDFWEIFRPLNLKFTDQIMRTRNKKISIAHFHEAHYKITDLLCEIMKKTVQFLSVAQKMRNNIIAAKQQNFIIEPLDAAHLQIYLNQKAPDLLRKDVELIFKHIMRNKLICLKSFHECLIPMKLRSDSLNPNFVKQEQQADKSQGIQLMKTHMQNIDYVNKTNYKKPLYLTYKHKTTKNKLSF